MGKRLLKGAAALLLTAALLLPAFVLTGAALAAPLTWEEVNEPGFGITVPTDNRSTFSMAGYNGKLYAGTFNNVLGCQVWRYDGPDPADWVQVNDDGFGDVNNRIAYHMAVYKGLLYVSTMNSITGAEVWAYDGTDWAQANTDGFGDVNTDTAAYMLDFNGLLWVGAGNDVTGAEVWAYDGTDWAQANTDAFGDIDNWGVRAMVVFEDQLYAGVYNSDTGCQVWCHDGPDPTDWTKVADAGLGNVNNEDARSLAVYNNELYMGIGNSSNGGTIYKYDGGTSWTDLTPPWMALVDPPDAVRNMLIYGGELYCGLSDDDTGCEVWSWSGTAWDQRNVNGFGDLDDNLAIHSMAVFEGYLWAGTGYSDTTVEGCGVWRTYVAPTWYLAEGATAGDFETYILVQNPNATAVTVDVDFMTSAGLKAGPQGASIPANSRVTFKANEYVTDYNVSTMVTPTGGGVICERAMYGNGRTWAHDSIGVTDPADTWYLAEGATAGDFETWVLVQNPNATAVTVDVDFMTGAGAVPGPQDVSIPANSRKTFKANDSVTDYNVSTMVTADMPVICERAMYDTARTWAHDSIGVTDPAYGWYLAEGATAGDFETYILVQNPNAMAVTVDVDFMTGAGAVPGPQNVSIPANSRKTFKANDSVTDYNVSTMVTANMPVICERAVYGNGRTWAHDSIGATSMAYAWYLAEGATAGDFETWVLVQNPNAAAVTVDLTLMTGAGVQTPTDLQNVSIPANSRVTFKPTTTSPTTTSPPWSPPTAEGSSASGPCTIPPAPGHMTR